MDRESKKKRGGRRTRRGSRRTRRSAMRTWRRRGPIVGRRVSAAAGGFRVPVGGEGGAGGLVALESDGWDLRHVFFSSLVDGQRATIGIPGDRLCRPKPAPIAIPDGDPRPSNDADADVECIWAAALREPLVPIVCTGGERKMG
uniref:Uncharacterized protein n=1 Tax=Ananas comosus var. bracteatus TaxID=296719 RepID=A0A6V7QVX2_ANACO